VGQDGLAVDVGAALLAAGVGVAGEVSEGAGVADGSGAVDVHAARTRAARLTAARRDWPTADSIAAILH
jgi:hypothetical protein